MKKISFYILPLFCGLSVISCDDKVTPEEEEVVMNETDQKSFIEEVAIDLAGKVPSKDFEEIKNFAMDLSEITTDQSWAMIGDSMKASYMKCVSLLDEKQEVDTAYYHYWGYDEYDHLVRYVDTSFIDVSYYYYEIVLTLSNFTGHYTQTDNSWSYTEANDLQFSFKDGKGKDCVLKVAKEGKEAKLRIGPDEYDDFEPEYWMSNVSVYRSDACICVPEKVTLSLSRNGQNVTELTVKYDINNLTKDGYFDLGKSNSAGGLEFSLNNGYKLSVETKATANDKLSLNYSLTKDGGELFSYTISGDPSGVPSIVLNAGLSEREFSSAVQDGNANIKNAYMCASIDGKLKMIGKVEDLRALLVIEDSMESNWRNGEKYKTFVEEENKHLDLGLYYGNSNKKQASVEMEAYCETERYWVGSVDNKTWITEEYWNTRPVLVFSDSVRTSFEEFFSKDDFTKALKAFEALEEDYENFIGGDK